MKKTELLEIILEKAAAWQEKLGNEYLTASHVAVAVAEFCGSKYIGFSVSDMTYFPNRYEEERLRYIFSNQSKLSSFFRMMSSKNAREGVKEPSFSLESCEKLAAVRNNDVLSADLVFLCALKELPNEYKKAIRTEMTDSVVISLLEEIDKNIYDFVINKISDICAELTKKADEAAAIRDWKPADKFVEPNEFSKLFFEKIEAKISDNEVTLKFPKFFGRADLKVTFCKVGEIYYVHDNGSAIRHLKRRVNDEKKAERALNRVCNSCFISKGRVTGSFVSVRTFIYYLERLIFIAHADLYYTRAERQLYGKDKSYVYKGNGEPFDAARLFEELKDGIGFDYDENQGLYFWLNTTYSNFSTRPAFLVESFENKIRISDRRKDNQEGRIFEAFYWDNDDISKHSKFIGKLADRFGACFDGNDVYLTEKTENVVSAMFKFFNLAILLSEFGNDIV